jgi:hypothetical protein
MIIVRCRSLAVEDPRGVTLLETQLASLFWEEVEQEIMLIGVRNNAQPSNSILTLRIGNVESADCRQEQKLNAQILHGCACGVRREHT